jgi:general secretion pathway protein J
MSRRRHHHPAAGFTLLEAIVALLLIGLVLSALSNLAGQWIPSWKHGLSRLRTSEGLALALGRLASDVSAAEFISMAPSDRQPLFIGKPQSLIFARRTWNPGQDPALEIVKIEDLKSNERPYVTRSRAPFSLDASARAAHFTDAVILLRDNYRLFFSYAGPDRIWHDDWGEERLPEFVKLTVRDPTGRSVIATTTASVHSAIPLRCIHAQSLQNCYSLLKSASRGG